MQDWIAWCLALIRTSVQWLGTVQLLGVSVLWIVIAAFFPVYFGPWSYYSCVGW